jgi:hypothetical protein
VHAAQDGLLGELVDLRQLGVVDARVVEVAQRRLPVARVVGGRRAEVGQSAAAVEELATGVLPRWMSTGDGAGIAVSGGGVWAPATLGIAATSRAATMNR